MEDLVIPVCSCGGPKLMRDGEVVSCLAVCSFQVWMSSFLGFVSEKKDGRDDDCPICLSPLVSSQAAVTLLRTKCGHCYHMQCLIAYCWDAVMSPPTGAPVPDITCPVCRKVFLDKDAE